ncbi:acyl-CoA thioesterase [Mycolicibacterium phlei]|uniref:acyl-CoA thioesterase n=1 Tax=Mycobacteroides chelonae TaxID=1774 RepID=UPI000618D189|nr:acyl-CoA thioesterase II [Mycobacteroides chelonae]VEG17646.1 acyl-CoA thioesterase [Mycolicibacterium phlei]AKC39392.1 acyl-CoA thioesterase [Mycobacteroides chelonae]ANA98856.1 acyl-CoA thioesterase [Mycobacteroides chelonae CCUG 47445]OLT72594.1 acyl-CoA thioesterase II [Mycobacteroides chelonae]ORV11921.1 acyl-CoA thioesterase II [Mycobacteroides chelonae]
MADIEEILTLEQLEKDIFRGNVTPSSLRRTFGGQVAGQSLVSAVRTVEPQYLVHSLHGYFLRPGNPNEPTVFLVDRVRDGRSFSTRRVTAIQDGQAIFSMSASFQTLDTGIEHQDLMPPVPTPEDLPDVQDAEGSFSHDLFRQFAEWDIRIVPDELMDRNPRLAAQQRVWFRCRKQLPDDPVLHICALAYMSDLTLLSSSKVPHRDAVLQTASLDHALWFLRPFRADEWLLYDETSPSAGYGRALTQGRIFDREGRMVAAVVQEGLTRYERNPDEASIAKGNMA